MDRKTTDLPSQIACGVAVRALPGQDICGDVYLIKATQDGVLVAVVDGLGHGAEAAAAAKIAIGVLHRHAENPLGVLISRCHEALTKTRGVVMTVASIQFAEGQLTWLGVGNVEAALLRADGSSSPSHKRLLLRGASATGTAPALAKGLADRVLLRSGIVGYRTPEVRLRTQRFSPGDLLILATDGIRTGFLEDLDRSAAPQVLAGSAHGTALQRHRRCAGACGAVYWESA